jgi:hypothetical protein
MIYLTASTRNGIEKVADFDENILVMGFISFHDALRDLDLDSSDIGCIVSDSEFQTLSDEYGIH